MLTILEIQNFKFYFISDEGRWEGNSLVYTILFWFIMIALYFGILMMLQRTLKAGAIGGQVSWKSIIFKSVEVCDYSNTLKI